MMNHSLQFLITVLIETLTIFIPPVAYSPSKQRVLGAYSWVAGILKIVGEKADSVREAIETDRSALISPVPIAWDYVDPAPIVDFDIYNYSVVMNEVLGIEQIIYTDVPVTIQVEQSERYAYKNSYQLTFTWYSAF